MNSVLLTFKYVFVDLLGGIIRAPFWWYTSGLKLTLTWMGNSIQGYTKSISLGVWIKNLFVPMYGQYDWQSRIISFIMRFFMIIGRGLTVMVWSVVVLLLVGVYLVLPPLAAIFAVYHLFGSLV